MCKNVVGMTKFNAKGGYVPICISILERKRRTINSLKESFCFSSGGSYVLYTAYGDV